MCSVRSKQAIGNLFSFYFAYKTVFRHKMKCLFPKKKYYWFLFFTITQLSLELKIKDIKCLHNFEMDNKFHQQLRQFPCISQKETKVSYLTRYGN